METFSQKYGFKPIKNVLQIEEMDNDLRNSLWNGVDLHFISEFKGPYMSNDADAKYFYQMLCLHYFKNPMDT